VRLVGVAPSPPLSAYVELFWFVRGQPDYECEKVLPNGVIELIFNLGAPHKVLHADDPTRVDSFFDAWLAGLQEHFLLIQPVDTFDLVGVRFRPGGATPFLRLSPTELTNQVVESESLSNRLAELIAMARERLLRAADMHERVAILEALLLQQLDPNWTVSRAVRQALDELRRPAPSRIGALSPAMSTGRRSRCPAATTIRRT
jgi:hypothetical protein